MLNIRMPKSPSTTKSSLPPAVEVALKTHVLASDPEVLADVSEGTEMMREIAAMVDLTEAPEDAVCGLVIDLLLYCEREKIAWTSDVMSRSLERFRGARA